jgi:uncharacterized surface protein with fasciclin (FAS1) repeats
MLALLAPTSTAFDTYIADNFGTLQETRGNPAFVFELLQYHIVGLTTSGKLLTLSYTPLGTTTQPLLVTTTTHYSELRLFFIRLKPLQSM